MKTLYLMRHGRAEPQQADIDDIGRKLTDIGISRTRKVSSWLKMQQIEPQLIVCSHSARTQETAEILAKLICVHRRKQKILKSLYMASADELFGICKKFDDTASSVMLVGHDPGLCDFVNAVAGTHMDKIKTSAVVGICFPGNRWQDIKLHTGEVVFLHNP